MGRDKNGAVLPIAESTRALQKIRGDAWQTEVAVRQLASGESTDQIALELVASDPFGQLAYKSQHLQIPKFTSDDAAYTDWWSRSQHLTLIGLVALGRLNIDNTERNKAYLEYNQRAIVKFVTSTPLELKELVMTSLFDNVGFGFT